MPTLLNVGQRQAYERDGYTIIPSLFDTEEIRTAEAAKRLETLYIKRKAGDDLFFYCNTLHCSDQNRSPNRRWTLICYYNAARNGPYLDHHHLHYTKLKKYQTMRSTLERPNMQMHQNSQPSWINLSHHQK